VTAHRFSRAQLTGLLLMAACKAGGNGSGSATVGWPAYGGDPGGARYSAAAQISPRNVARLRVAWTYRTGDASDGGHWPSTSRFEATPILGEGTLYLSTPFDRVVALDPATGSERWRFDPGIDLSTPYSEGLVSRGVAYWRDSTAAPNAPCGRAIFLATLDARLIALDAQTGTPCPRFGRAGAVSLAGDVGPVQRGQYEVTSPPAVMNGIVVVGSAVGDNRGVAVEQGTVHGLDARTGALRWSWDPIPRDSGSPAWPDWKPDQARRTGAGNAWGVISADPARDLVFVPTGSAAPDYYGGERLGANRYANSVVALRASTGALVWAFQVVHHDLWNYDVAAEPALVTIRQDGRDVPAVVVSTKMGHVFVLSRETGAPLFPVVERPVPHSDVPGEAPWPTQPFPVRPPPLDQHSVSPADAWGPTPQDLAFCRDRLEHLRHDGIFTPPSLGGSVMYPGAVGGTNWGGVAVQGDQGLVVTAINRLAFWAQLVPANRVAMLSRDERNQLAEQRGTPYWLAHGPLVSPSRLPCTRPPWSSLVTVDLKTGAVRWEVPLGTIPPLTAQAPDAAKWGSVTLGGPIVTAGGLVFIAAALDDSLRAFDLQDGKELWSAALPAGGQATPMTYQLTPGGKQYVVIAAGGHGALGTTFGDYVVAFALP